MKLFLFSASAVLCHLTLMGQVNLVVNPSFEDTVNCPTGDDQVFNAVGWENYSDQSPDYFNSCTSNNDVSVPNNWGGYQPASSGNAYCAVSTFYPATPNKREIIGSSLSQNLVIGTKYYFKMRVSLSIDNYIASSYACNKLGVRFSTVPYSFSNPAPINNTAHIWTDSIITDTTNWTTIFDSFIADSSYSNMALGNFFDDSNTDTSRMAFGSPPFNFAYYFIDDVCISTDSAFAYNYTAGIAGNNLSSQIIVYPNPIVDYLIVENSSNQPVDIIIYNVLGELIYSMQNANKKNLSLNLADTQKGILFLNIKTKTESVNYKLLKL